MKSFSMMGSMGGGDGSPSRGGSAGGEEDLPPTVSIPSTVASTGCSLGSWRIMEAGGGFGGRYRHLLLIHGPSPGEVSVAGRPQLSLPQADEWGPATGAFYLRDSSGAAFKLGEDGTRAEDAYNDMPRQDTEEMVVLGAVEPPPLCVPGAYSWGADGSQWSLKATSDGTVRVTHAAVDGSPYVLRLSPEGNVHLTSQDGATHSLHPSVGAAPVSASARENQLDADRALGLAPPPPAAAAAAPAAPAAAAPDTVTVSATEWVGLLERLGALEEAGQESYEKMLTVDKKVRDTAEMMGEQASEAEGKIESLEKRLDASSSFGGNVGGGEGGVSSEALDSLAQAMQTRVAGVERKLKSIGGVVGTQAAAAAEQLAAVEKKVRDLTDMFGEQSGEMEQKLEALVAQVATAAAAQTAAPAAPASAALAATAQLAAVEKKVRDVTEMMGEQSGEVDERIDAVAMKVGDKFAKAEQKIEALSAQLAATEAKLAAQIEVSLVASAQVTAAPSATAPGGVTVEQLSVETAQIFEQVQGVEKKLRDVTEMMGDQSSEIDQKLEALAAQVAVAAAAATAAAAESAAPAESPAEGEHKQSARQCDSGGYLRECL